MSKQLAFSSALSILAMAALVLFGTPASADGPFAPAVTVSVPQLPNVGTVLLGQ